ncbi:hypothetical protein AURDEDRAFT_140588 [Auricularia subglabra TFB-10046 SS5]|uniref:F-box domain-containing protein n=1 Tax=Auricularia subglabra (strain TFB-10046 / SS5) TaxID=717982 RepID=J0D5Y2_AURST|nr:hypothetical protein AURDEDRAFT_140588 [Auricularia subglabra TFB-10046 SS5]
MSRSVRRAVKISPILLSLSSSDAASSCIIVRLARQWNASHDVLRVFPAEMLAACFTFLPFRGRIFASHVSSTWRNIALDHPAVWSDIELSDDFRDEPALLDMALSRSGSHAVELRYAADPDADGVVASCLTAHMHHFRVIHWDSRQQIIPFNLPAPLLEEVWAIHYDTEINEVLLDGRARQLRKLCLRSVRLPMTCPALSTIEHLSLHVTDSPDQYSRLGRLFHLCPSLQSLALGSLKLPHTRLLLSGPAPRSLKVLSLQSSAPDSDLVQRYSAWKSGCTLRDVSFTLDHVPEPNFDIAALISGAYHLEFTLDLQDSHSRIMASRNSRTGGLQVGSVRFVDEGRGQRAANLILRAREGLGQDLLFFGISAKALALFVENDVFYELTHIRFLTVVIAGTVAHGYDWEPLLHLAHVKATCPHLHTVFIPVEACEYDVPPGSDDARVLVATLVQSDTAGPLTINIKGFPAAAVRDVPLRDIPDLNIVFV